MSKTKENYKHISQPKPSNSESWKGSIFLYPENIANAGDKYLCIMVYMDFSDSV